MADLNGDDANDAVTVGVGANMTVWLGGASDELAPTTDVPVGTGAQEVMLGVSVLIGNGNATFQAAQSFPAGNGPLGLAVADLNGDGRLDIATASNDFSTTPLSASVLLGNGNGMVLLDAVGGYELPPNAARRHQQMHVIGHQHVGVQRPP